jgi:hypothetical protein
MKKPNPLYEWALRAGAPLRWLVGGLLIVGGLFGFLPVLGFWMVPVGLLVLASGSPRGRELAKQALRRLRAWLGGKEDDGPEQRRRRRNLRGKGRPSSR